MKLLQNEKLLLQNAMLLLQNKKKIFVLLCIYKSSEKPQGNKGRGNGYGEKLTLGQQGFWGSLHPWGFSEDL